MEIKRAAGGRVRWRRRAGGVNSGFFFFCFFAVVLDAGIRSDQRCSRGCSGGQKLNLIMSPEKANLS